MTTFENKMGTYKSDPDADIVLKRWHQYQMPLVYNCLYIGGLFLIWKEGNVLFNDTLNTFYLRLYGVRHMVKDHCDSERGNPMPHIGYSFRLTARVLLYVPSHRQDSTYHSLCYTSHGALAGTRNSSMGPPYEGSIQRPIAPWANALTTELHLAPFLICVCNFVLSYTWKR